jgi:protein ImuB
MPIVCAFVPSYKTEIARLGAATWTNAIDALDLASPLVEDAGHGLAFLEMRGIDGGAQRWLRSVREALAGCERARTLPFRLALAANKFVARAAARVADGTIVRRGEEAAFVAPLPLHALDLGNDLIERLHLFGVRTLGELAALPHGPFVRRFGPGAAAWHAQARGVDETPLVPHPRALRIDHTLYGEGTAEREDQLLFALRALVLRIADDVAYAGKRCGFLRLAHECEDGETHELPTPLAQPTSQSGTMFDLLRTRLEGVVLRSPVTGLRLGAERLEEGGAELSLFAGGDPDPEIVAIALARLEVALGPHATLRAHVAPGNRYETRFAYEPFSATALTRRAVAPTAPQPALSSVEGLSETGTLAYRILTPREIAVYFAGGRPARVAGRSVLDAAGPWRVDELWWAEALDEGAAPYACDAYDVSLEDGALWRIVAERGRWYLRGIYD